VQVAEKKIRVLVPSAASVGSAEAGSLFMVCTGHNCGITMDLDFHVVRFQNFEVGIGIGREGHFFTLLITLPSVSVSTRSSALR
jgi:hypothetical protein